MKSENRSRGLASWAILLPAKVMHLYDKSKKKFDVFMVYRKDFVYLQGEINVEP